MKRWNCMVCGKLPEGMHCYGKVRMCDDCAHNFSRSILGMGMASLDEILERKRGKSKVLSDMAAKMRVN